MSIPWPTTLPKPSIDFGAENAPNILRTQMDAGTVRQRRRWTQETCQVSVKWNLTDIQFAMFTAWHRHDLDYGMNIFLISLPLSGGGFFETPARFVGGKFGQQYEHVGRWNVTASLEVENRAVLSANASEIYGEYDGDTALLDEFEAVVSDAHAAIHAPLPAYLGFPLDSWAHDDTLQGAWSIARRLFLRYRGPLIRVRRQTAGTELDVYPTPNGLLDEVALLAFSEVGGFEPLRVIRAYTQIAGTVDMIAGVAASAPMLVPSSGVINRDSLGLPSPDFGVGYLTSTFARTLSASRTIYARIAHDGTVPPSYNPTLWYIGGTDASRFYISSATSYFKEGDNGADTVAQPNGAAQLSANVVSNIAGQDKIYLDGVNLSESMPGGVGADYSTTFIRWGASATPNINNSWLQRSNELVVFLQEHSAATIQAITARLLP